MRCPRCGHANPPDVTFCVQCGWPMAEVPTRARGTPGQGPSPADRPVVRCPTCGRDNPAGGRHCIYCGALLPSNEPASQAHQEPADAPIPEGQLAEAELERLDFLAQETGRLLAEGALDAEAQRRISAVGQEQRTRLLLDMARAHRDAGRLPEAQARYEQLLALRSEHASALHELGEVYRRAGFPSRALDALLRALLARPDWDAPHLALAQVYEELRNDLLAAFHLQQAERLQSGTSAGETRVRISRLRARLGALVPSPPEQQGPVVAATDALIDYLLREISRMEALGVLSRATGEALRRRYRPELAPSARVAEPAALTPVAPAREPVAPQRPPPLEARPPRPPRPPFRWDQVWAGLFSERTLRVMLSLGGLFVVVAALVQVAVNWDRFSPVLQLLILLATTAALYAAGILLRRRPGYQLTAQLFLYLGGILVPVDSFAVTREGLLDLPRITAWLVVSAIASPVYFGTFRLLRDRLSAYMTALSLGSLLLAALSVADVPLEWRMPPMLGLAVVYLLGWRLPAERAAWLRMREALFWVSQAATLLLIMASGILAQEAFQSALTTGKPAFIPSLAVTLWAASGYHGLHSWFSGRRWGEYVTLVVVTAAFLATLSALSVPFRWYGLSLALMAGGYLLYGRLLRRDYGRGAAPWQAWIDQAPAYVLAYVALVASLLWPHVGVSRVASLYTASAVLGLSALLFRAEVFSYLTLLGFFASTWYTMALYDVAAQPQNLVFEAMALLFLAVGRGALRARPAPAEGAQEETPLLAGLRAAVSRPFIVAAYVLTLFILLKTTVDLFQSPGERVLAEVSYLGLAAIYALSAYVWRSPLFVYLAAVLFLWPFSLAGQLVFHTGWALGYDYLPSYLAALSASYVVLGFLLQRAKTDFARPLHWIGYPLGLLAIPLNLVQAPVLLATLAALVPAYGLSAWLLHHERHRPYQWLLAKLFRDPERPAYGVARSLFVYLASWLAVAILALALALSGVPLEWQGVVLSIVALAYVALGLYARRLQRGYPYPLYIMGYFLSGVAVLLAYPAFPLRALTLIAAVALYAASARIFRQPLWLYLVAGLGPLVEAVLFRVVGLPLRFVGLGFLALAPLYLVLGLRLGLGRSWRQRRGEAAGPYGLPFLLGGYALAAIALAVSAPQGREIAIAAFALGGAIYVASAYLLRQPVFLYAGAASLVVPYSLLLSYITVIPAEYFELAHLPLVVAYLLLGRRLGGPTPLRLRSLLQPERLRAALESPSAPFYIGAYLGTLTIPVVGTVVAQLGGVIDPRAPLAAALAADALIYWASARLFRNTLWLYAGAAAFVAAYYLGLTQTPIPFSSFGIALAPLVVAYLAAARLLARARATEPGGRTLGASIVAFLGSAPAPFYLMAYLGTLVTPMVWWQEPRALGIVLGANALVYFYSAWLFRNTLWLYAGAAAFVAAYYLGLTQIAERVGLEFRFFGLALLPLAVLYLAVARLLARSRASPGGFSPDLGWLLSAIASPATPFYLFAYWGTMTIPLVWHRDAGALSAVLAGDLLVYGYSAWLFRRSVWLYAALAAGHLAYVQGAVALGLNVLSPQAAYLLAPAAFFMAALAVATDRWATIRGGMKSLSIPGLKSLGVWALPFGIFALMDVAFATYAGQLEPQTGAVVGLAFLLLFAVLSYLWRSEALAWATFGYLVLASVYALVLAGVALANLVAYTAALALLLVNLAYLLRLALERSKVGPLQPLSAWARPFRWGAFGLSGLGFLPFIVYLGPDGLDRSQGVHLALAFLALGAMYLSVSAWERALRVSYAGLGFLAASLTTLWVVLKLTEQQAYLVPWGLYVVLLGFGERFLGNRRLGRYLEAGGLGAILVFTQLEMMGFVKPIAPQLQQGLFVLLFFESIGVIVLGALRRVKAPFFAGIVFLLLNIFLWVFDAMRGRAAADWLYVLLVVGIVLIGIGVYVERRRERLRQRALEILEALERWE